MTTSVSMSELMKEFSISYGLGEEGEKELINLFNKSLIEISARILERSECSVKKTSEKIEKSNKRFASKKAEEYAYENNLSLDDFENEKISKKEVEEKVRKLTKEKNTNVTIINTKISNDVSSSSKKVDRKVLCCGLTKKGEQCNRAGSIKPLGAKKMYCFRHSDEWQTFECESDSSDEDNLRIENIKEKKSIDEDDSSVEKLSKKESSSESSDENLFE